MIFNSQIWDNKLINIPGNFNTVYKDYVSKICIFSFVIADENLITHKPVNNVSDKNTMLHIKTTVDN